MNVEELPDPEDRDAVIRFAASFSGYEHFGSFKACADEAKLQKRDTLIDLRNELFFYFRASNHQGSPDGVVPFYRELLPRFRQLLSNKP
jgi:hypothetical protein